MKYQKKQEIKKQMLAIIALVMALIMVLSLIAPFTIFAAPVSKTLETVGINSNGDENAVDDTIGSLKTFGKDQFSVELQAGFDENYIVKKPMPVCGVITNHGDAFHGEVQIKAYTRAVNTDEEYAIYYQDLDLEQGASQAIDVEATMGNIHKYLEVSLVDEKGNKVYQDYIFLTPKESKTIVIGVLSESTQDLKYLQNLQLAQVTEDGMTVEGKYQTELNKKYDFHVNLDKNTFPHSIEILNSFSVIVADDFDFSVFTEEQKEALHQWILGGGTILVGTGAGAEKALNSLDFLSEIQMKGTTTISELQGVAGEISLAQLSGEGLTKLSDNNGTKPFSILEEGKGHVVFSHFSLSQGPMAGQNATLEMLAMALHEAAPQAFNVNLYDDGGYYERLRYIAEDFPPFQMSSILLIFGAIAVYIVIVGPVLYFILKKKDKREKGWIFVPVFSFVFMGLVFLLAQSSSYKSGMINAISVIEMKEGSHIAKADIGVAVKYANKGDVTFTSDEKMPINVNMEDNYYRDSSSNKEKCAYRIFCGNTTEVTFSDSQSWDTQYFNTQKSVDLGGAIESNVEMKDGRFVGEIINHTNVDFYRVVLMLDGYIQQFDALKAGESLQVDVPRTELTKENNVYYDGYDYGAIREQVANRKITRQEAYLRYMEQDLQQQYYEYEENAGLIPVSFFGYSQAPILGGEKKLNGKQVQEHNITMYMQNFPLELSKQKEFEIELPGLVDAPVKYDEYSDEFGNKVYPYEESDFYVSYTIPNGVRVDQMEFRADGVSDEVVPEKANLWNRKTQEYDEITLGERISAENYIDETNLVVITMHCLSENEMAVPKLMIQGGGLNVGN